MSTNREEADRWNEIEYLAGRASDGQRRQTDGRLAADSAAARDFDLLKQAWEHTSASDRTFDQNDERKAWHALQQRIQQPVLPSGHTAEKKGRTTPRAPLFKRNLPTFLNRWPLAVAATSIAAATAVVIGVTQLQESPAPASDPLRSSYTTGNGERATIELPDGTKVVLNVASRLEILRSFGTHNRAVRLTGEAYFDVKHATGAPFIVESGSARTTVLGTEFGVRAYSPSSDDVQIAVRTGKVSVNNTVLTANDIARVNQAGATTVATGQHLDVALAFAAGRLMLPETTVSNAIGDLNRWYDADIRLGDAAVGKLRLRGMLASGSIDDLKANLQLTLGVRVERNGRTLTLYSR